MKGRERALRLGCFLWWMSSYGAAEPALERTPLSEHDTNVLHVSWRANPDCGDARTVAELVQELIGSDENKAPMRHASATVEVTKTQRSFRVALTFSDGTRVGRRTLDVESCDAVIDATTLVIAVALQPDLRWEAALARLAELRTRSSRLPSPHAVGVLPDLEPEPTKPKPTEPATTPKRSVPSTESTFFTPEWTCSDGKHSKSPETTTPRSTARVHIAASALIDTETLPSWSGGFKAGIGVNYASVSVDVGGLLLLPRDATVPDDSTRGATMQFYGGQARLCSASHWPYPTISVNPCAGAILAAISGEPFGLRARNRVEAYFAATLGSDVELRIHRDLAIVGGFAAIVPLRRVSLVVSGVDAALHRTPTALQWLLGAKWTL